MKKLLYYIPHRLYRSVKDVDPVTKEFVEMFNPWISLSDRTGTLDIPGVPVFNNSPIPAKPDIVPSFSATSYKRIDDCIEQLKQQGKERLVVFHSGGIDSTLIVSLLVSHPDWHELKKVTWLAVNEDSQIENPDFFNEIVLPNFGTHLLASNQFYDIINDKKNVCITGECADNLFGSLTLKGYMDSTGTFETAIHGNWQAESLPWLLDKGKNLRDEREDMLSRLVAASPVPIETNHDFLWWLNFAMKWQAVKYRMAMHSPTAAQAEYMAGNVVNFFDSEQYQQWALYTREPKVGTKWNTYKLPAKQLINDIWTNEKYLKYKTKWPSLPSITRYNNAWGFLWQNEDGSLTATKEFE
jgi:hypothetical protein